MEKTIDLKLNETDLNKLRLIFSGNIQTGIDREYAFTKGIGKFLDKCEMAGVVRCCVSDWGNQEETYYLNNIGLQLTLNTNQ